MIERVLLHNYKSIKTADIRLGQINLLIGGNGAGKSNFISVFDLLLAVYNQRLGEYVLRHGGANRMLYNGYKESSEIELLFDFDNTNTLYLKLQPSQETAKLFVSESGDYFNHNIDTTKNYGSAWNYKRWDNMVEESRILDSRTWRSDYLKKDLKGVQVYHFHDTSRTAPMRGMCNINDNDGLRPDGSNLAACLYKMQQLNPRSFLILEGVIRSVAPYFKRFKLQPNAFDESQILMQWEAVDTDNYFDSYSFSDGTIRFIALATLLMHEDRPSTLIIDEPELGLHPFAIVKLAALVRKASLDSQIILASQSTNLINQFEPENVIVVDREDRQTVFRNLNREDLEVWLESYNIGDIWEKNLIGGLPR